MTIDHEQRRHCIGASEVSAVLGISPYQTSHGLWLEKTEQVEPWAGNKSTKIGKKLESVLLDDAEERYGELTRDVRVPSPNGSPLTATLDGLVVDQNRPVECKTSGMTGGPVKGDWGEELTDQIPDYYLLQVQAQLYCSGADLAYVLAWLGQRGILEYHVPRSPDLINIIVERCSEWWDRHMTRGIAPEIRTVPPLELMKRLRREASKRITLDSHAIDILDCYERARITQRKATEELDLAQSSVLALLADAEEGVLPDGRRITYYEQCRKAYMVKESKFRVLRVKE